MQSYDYHIETNNALEGKTMKYINGKAVVSATRAKFNAAAKKSPAQNTFQDDGVMVTRHYGSGPEAFKITYADLSETLWIEA